MDVCGKALPKAERQVDIIMNMKREIIKYGVAILAIVNMIWLFGFQYRLPRKATDNQTVEAADTATTSEAADVATTAEAVDVITSGITIDFAEEEEPEEDAETEENAVRCRVDSNSLNVREGPGTNYNVVTTAKYNEMLTVLDVENGWVHIRNDGGQEGYVSENYVEIVENQSE